MGILTVIRALWRGGTAGFTPLEMQILRAVCERLDGNKREKLQRRIAGINLVQRLDGGREVNSYEMRDGKPMMDAALRLTDEKGDKILAEFSFTTSAGVKNKGKICLSDGDFFSLAFADPTEHMLDEVPQDLLVTVYL